jgi:DNA invertase Pin-like site-specific DNA recombinase
VRAVICRRLPAAGNFTLHIYASIAQQERKMIGERISAAHLIAKKRGTKFGLELRSKAERRRVAALGRAAKTRQALERAQANRMYIEWALQQPGINGTASPAFLMDDS